MSGAWKLAVRNLSRNRRRNLATGLAIALGFAALVVLSGYLRYGERFLRANAVYIQHGGHVAVFREGGLALAWLKPGEYRLTRAEQDTVTATLAADPRVEFSAPFLRGMGLVGNGCRAVPFVGLGVDLAQEQRIMRHREVQYACPDLAQPLAGRELSSYTTVDGAVSLAAGLAKLLGKQRVHDEVPNAVATPPDCAAPDLAARIAADANVQLAAVTYDGAFSAVDAEMVSVVRANSMDTEDTLLLASLPTLQRLYETDGVTYIAAFLHDVRETHAVAADVEARLRALGLRVTTHSFDDERVNPYFVGTMAFLDSMRFFIDLLVMAVVALSMVNATTLSVLERTRELGTLRALGFQRGELRNLFLRETLILTTLALCAGLVVALGAIAVFNATGILVEPPGIPGRVRLRLEPTVVQSAGLALEIALVLLGATWVAVRRQTRTRVVTLLAATSG